MLKHQYTLYYLLYVFQPPESKSAEGGKESREAPLSAASFCVSLKQWGCVQTGGLRGKMEMECAHECL